MDTPLSEDALVSGLRAHDEAAFEEFIRRYGQRVMQLAMRLTRNEAEAEDIMQEVFVIVFRRIEMFAGKSAFSSWLYRVTANASLMRLRKRRSQMDISYESMESVLRDTIVSTRREESDPNLISIRHELREQLELAIQRLPEDYRSIFVLKDVDGMASEDVASLVGMTVAAVKSRLHRARLMLRKSLEHYHHDVHDESFIALGTTGVRMLGGEVH